MFKSYTQAILGSGLFSFINSSLNILTLIFISLFFLFYSSCIASFFMLLLPFIVYFVCLHVLLRFSFLFFFFLVVVLFGFLFLFLIWAIIPSSF